MEDGVQKLKWAACGAVGMYVIGGAALLYRWSHIWDLGLGEAAQVMVFWLYWTVTNLPQ